ncbi:MAG: type I DNA topoisomerase [Dongiaceae bacterium]
MTKIVVVESPAKAKTINKYLGDDFRVIASYGHIRDLPSKDGSVDPEADFAMRWELDERGDERIREITKLLNSASHLYLATDPDREGEAISWHIQEVLKENRALKGGLDVKRVVFNEITKNAIRAAFDHPRELDARLIEAYLARRALDYLVGFTLSPVLWRKLPGSKSAGRVQSVALRLIAERESEIEAFKPQEYWSILGDFLTQGGQPFTARLTHLNGKKLEKFSITQKAEADAAVAALRNQAYSIASIESKNVKRNPPPPFMTSTMQMEASRKLGFGASRTMRLAQQLYEGVDIGGETVGLITYMRTDGLDLSQEAIQGCRQVIGQDFGNNYLPDSPRVYKSKLKNAQEAHEAVRPTDLSRRPEQMRRYLDPDQFKLYELIWKRTLASQMAQASLEQVAVDVATSDGKNVFRATGSIVLFDGFLKLYQEDFDDPNEDEEQRRLPKMAKDEAAKMNDLKGEQHFTQPPPRYSEASLVKRLEELGIGRPSTYASIIQVLQDRKYVRLDKKRFIPEDRGRVVTTFLIQYFPRYVEYGFTADMEEQLDMISDGSRDWRQVLHEFWEGFSAAVGKTKDLTITQVIDALDAELGPHFFPTREDGSDPRLCTACGGRLGLKLGKFGAFIGCSNYPECKNTRPLTVDQPTNEDGTPVIDVPVPKDLGIDPASQLMITLRKGPYGYYVQLGEATGKGKTAVKPKRAPVLKNIPPTEVDLEKALALLSLPREVGKHPESGEMIYAGVGRFGPYLKYGSQYATLPTDDDVLSIGLNRAVIVIAEKPAKGQRRGGAPATPARVVGNYSDGKPIKQGTGRFGPYVQHGKTYASIPKDMNPELITQEEAIELIDKKLAKGKKPKKEAAEAAPKAKKPRAKKTKPEAE